MVGLPDLRDRLSLSIHKPLLQRPHTRLEISPGSPELDRLATLALSNAARRKKELVERDVVEAIL